MARIVLDLDRKDVSVHDFTEAFEAQVRLVTQVMHDMGIPTNEVRWVVSDLKHGSTFAVAEPQIIGPHAYMADIDRAARMAGIGVRMLAESATRPKHFSDEALKTGRRLIQIVTESDAGRARLGFGEEQVTPSPMVISHVDTLMRGNLPSIGSIDGRLVSVSAGQEGAYFIAIHDRLRGRKVRCSIPDSILDRALKAFESRVIARGIIWSRSDGSAVRIDVRDFEVVPSDDKLPSAEDVRGILKGYERADGE
jgi:hypothetical protein